MYVRPECRKHGIGSKLVHESIQQVRTRNYEKLRLDGACFLSGAHGVCRAAGFSGRKPGR
jgi:GNAT superfamily N-acetyltransferase